MMRKYSAESEHWVELKVPAEIKAQRTIVALDGV